VAPEDVKVLTSVTKDRPKVGGNRRPPSKRIKDPAARPTLDSVFGEVDDAPAAAPAAPAAQPAKAAAPADDVRVHRVRGRGPLAQLLTRAAVGMDFLYLGGRMRGQIFASSAPAPAPAPAPAAEPPKKAAAAPAVVDDIFGDAPAAAAPAASEGGKKPKKKKAAAAAAATADVDIFAD